ncbi:MAG TPA: 4a-hydroxytetrahydrobiopterin dehydratase [Nocardioides sp.]|uniref:4a-hydroxytetrahydrobiopterin dehydratase n=1 Tax=Nocardioides sp. TaxID=35761 RepID=UPI002BA2EEF0|nr:4a-hydroxytetrahydrobiopterin dehydratase [Nocardioides sp.]HTW14531.1 4a-hydroxytetrahydrobiopterin dehydratase [Nocardioides sp.]
MTDTDRDRLDGHAVEAELLADWRVMFSALHTRFRTGDFATGLALVNAIGEAAEAANHHPDVDLTYPLVTVRLSSHDVGGITQRDVRLAREISDAAGRLGAAADPAGVSVTELALDTHDRAEIMPFWAAVLGYETSEGDDRELVDPDGSRPTLWFQESERRSPEGVEQRFHLDVRVPPEVAEQRIRAAVDAGGTLVSDGRAPSFWVLADAQGNQACITTWLGREV